MHSEEDLELAYDVLRAVRKAGYGPGAPICLKRIGDMIPWGNVDRGIRVGAGFCWFMHDGRDWFLTITGAFQDLRSR